ERLSFFTSKTYIACFPRNENVVIFPFGNWGSATLWQAESGFFFRMPEGALIPGPPPASPASDPMVPYAVHTNFDPTPEQLKAFIQHDRVDRIMTVDNHPHLQNGELGRFGQTQDVGGITITPTCGAPALANPATSPPR